ncbi:MAG: hypothetical protein V3U27_21355 [Candidatus Tectomicrobia bacterium]
MEEEEQKRLQREMQLEIQRQKLREVEEEQSLQADFKVEQQRQQSLERKDSFRDEFRDEQQRQRTLDQQRAPRQDPNLVSGERALRAPQRGRPLPEGSNQFLDFAEQVQRRALDPLAAAGLQVGESPIGSVVPGVAELKALQESGGLSRAGRALGEADIGPRFSPARVALETAGAAATITEETLPRGRSFEETGRFVNPFKAFTGDEEEIERAQSVLQEAGFKRALAAQILFDPLNALPGVGVTKVSTFARLLKTATQATGRGRRAAVTALRNSDVVKDALRAGERGGPLRGGELGHADLPQAPNVVDAPQSGFHGTGAKFEAFEEGALDTTALYGPGVYITDDVSIATSYATRRARQVSGAVGTVEQVTPKPGLRLLNMEQSLPDEAIAVLERSAQADVSETADALFEGVRVAREGAPGKAVYSTIRNELRREELLLSAGDAGEVLESVNLTFKNAGFDGLTHVGGIKGGKPHRVSVLFDPADATISAEGRIPLGRGADPRITSAAEGPATPPLRGGELPGGSIADTSDEAVVHISKGDPGPPPPDQPPTGGGPPERPRGPSPDDPEFDDLLAAAIKGEKPEVRLMRRHQGVIDARASQLDVQVTANNEELVRIGLGQKFRGSVVAKAEGSFDELNSLLHNPGAVTRGERVVPDELRPIYDQLRAQTDFEQGARIDFDPDQALVEDYFYRGWKPPEGLFTGTPQRGSLGRNPSFRLPRVDATYDEMFEAGFRPMFENPAEQARHSQRMGMRYREQSRLVLKMQEKELALPVKGGPIPEGWRVPEVGPAFQGKPYADATGTGFTRQWAVTDEMANRLENIYGKMPKLGKGQAFGKTVDFNKVVDFLTFVPKRAKLVASVFQHLDFLSRSHFGAWTGFVDGLRRGQPIDAVTHLAKWPKSAVEIVHATFSPGARARLAKLGVDPKPLWKNRKISNLMLREEGLSLRDPTLGIDMDDVIRQVRQEPKIVRLGKAPLRLLDAFERQWRQGLFQGTYPAAILSDVKNNIGPMVLRQHPEATDRQLAGMIAEAANKLYSVIPESQSVIQNKQARFWLIRALFSLGENEGLLRSFTGAIRGPNAALFRTRLIGTYFGLMTLASTIHFASTGKPLPLDRFQPVSKDKFGPLPFGYNTDFAAPTLPIKGRGGAEITLDLVMQQDTIFRILDPKSFLNARFSVPVSTLRNQIAGTDFFGAPIDTVGPGGIFSRTSQLVQDMFAPIGAGQAGLELFRNNVEQSEGLITPGEGRLGAAGLGIQAGGVNLRVERTPQLLDRIRGEVLRDRGIDESYAEIAASNLPLKDEIDTEVEERIGAELEVRGETSDIRGQTTRQSEGFDALEATRERQQVEQLADDTKLNSNQWAGDTWRRNYADRQREFFASREQIKEDFEITFDDKQAPSKSVNEAIDAYFDIDIDDARYTRTDGTVDWDAFFDARDAALRPLSSADKRAVKAWLRKFDTPTVTDFRRAKDVVDRFFGMPKYEGLSVEKGEQLDEFLNVTLEEFQRRRLRESGRTLPTRRAILMAGRQAGLSDELLFIALRLRNERGRRRFVNPDRDEWLIQNELILAKFYPDLLEQQLSRAQEVELGEEAFEAIAAR